MSNIFSKKIMMKKIFFIFLCFNLISYHGFSQSKTENKIYNKDFNWTIIIPEGFETVEEKEWIAMQNKGANAIEDTFGEEIINHSKTIFVFKSGTVNYFESSFQPFDVAVDGDYIETCKAVNDILYETFMAQMPGITIERSNTIEKIDNLDFQVYKMKVIFPNKMEMYCMMFNRLFGKKELAVNIMYIDQSKGEKMLASWRASKFNK